MRATRKSKKDDDLVLALSQFKVSSSLLCTEIERAVLFAGRDSK